MQEKPAYILNVDSGNERTDKQAFVDTEKPWASFSGTGKIRAGYGRKFADMSMDEIYSIFDSMEPVVQAPAPFRPARRVSVQSGNRNNLYKAVLFGVGAKHR